MAARFCKPGERYEGLVKDSWEMDGLHRAPIFNGKLLPNPGVFEKPIHWKRPRVIFVCSMSDPFHEAVPKEWFDRLMDVVRRAPWHTYLFLTKRPENIPADFCTAMPLRHVWVGVTAENQEQADRRMAQLILHTPLGTKRFMSCEPLLGPISLMKKIGPLPPLVDWCDWLICGGESGPGFRPMQEDWVRGLRDEVKDAGIPFHYKQDAGVRPKKLPMLDGKVWDERPDFWRDR
jgi:protein gp37